MAINKKDGTQKSRDAKDAETYSKSGVSPFEIIKNGGGAVTRTSPSSITGGGKKPTPPKPKKTGK